MKLLALDFDGVISDSAPESFVVALRTYAGMCPESSLVSAGFADEDGAPALDRVAQSALFRSFLERIPLGNRAEDYGVLLRSLEVGAAIPDQAAYDAFRCASCERDWLHRYHRRFYETRSELSASDPQGWRALMSPYPPLLEMLRRRQGDAILAIATAKDRRTVGELLRGYGIEELFRDELVLDKETGVHKDAHLTHLQRRCGVAFSDITFLDDKVNHLDAVAHLGVRCGLAAWGYNSEREVALARERAYLVCELGDVERQLFG